MRGLVQGRHHLAAADTPGQGLDPGACPGHDGRHGARVLGESLVLLEPRRRQRIVRGLVPALALSLVVRSCGGVDDAGSRGWVEGRHLQCKPHRFNTGLLPVRRTG